MPCTYCHAYSNASHKFIEGIISVIDKYGSIYLKDYHSSVLDKIRHDIGHAYDNFDHIHIEQHLLDLRNVLSEIITHTAGDSLINDYLARLNGYIASESEFVTKLDEYCLCESEHRAHAQQLFFSRVGSDYYDAFDHTSSFPSSNTIESYPHFHDPNFDLVYALVLPIDQALPSALERMTDQCSDVFGTYTATEHQIIQYMDLSDISQANNCKMNLLRISAMQQIVNVPVMTSVVADAVTRLSYVGKMRDFTYFRVCEPKHVGTYYMHHNVPEKCLWCQYGMYHCWMQGTACANRRICVPHNIFDLIGSLPFRDVAVLYNIIPERSLSQLYDEFVRISQTSVLTTKREFISMLFLRFKHLGFNLLYDLECSENPYIENAAENLIHPKSLCDPFDYDEVVSKIRWLNRVYPELEAVNTYLGLLLTTNFIQANAILSCLDSEERVWDIMLHPEKASLFEPSDSLLALLFQKFVFQKFRAGIAFSVKDLIQTCLHEYKEHLKDEVEYDDVFGLFNNLSLQ